MTSIASQIDHIDHDQSDLKASYCESARWNYEKARPHDQKAGDVMMAYLCSTFPNPPPAPWHLVFHLVVVMFPFI